LGCLERFANHLQAVLYGEHHHMRVARHDDERHPQPPNIERIRGTPIPWTIHNHQINAVVRPKEFVHRLPIGDASDPARSGLQK
jgi:hypothetical protein